MQGSTRQISNPGQSPSCQALSQRKKALIPILAAYRKITHAHCSGLIDTYSSCPPDPTCTFNLGPSSPLRSTMPPQRAQQLIYHIQSLDTACPINLYNQLQHTQAQLIPGNLPASTKQHART